MTNRREFIAQISLGGSALLAGSSVMAAPMVAEADDQAKALNYVADATKSKNAKYVAGQNCTNCALYQGKATDAAGGCPLFAGKDVAGKAWCSGYMKKA